MTRGISADVLRRNALFADLPGELLEDVARQARPIFRKRGARIFEEGTVADCCLLLVEGRAKVVLADSADSQITLNILEPFTLIGEIGLLDDNVRSAGLVAVDDCRLVRIERATFLALRLHRPFEDRLVAHVAATLRRATEQLRAIYTFDSMERVAWCIARLAGSSPVLAGKEIVITPKPAHHELAEMTGCTRETVSRALLRLRRLGWVKWDARSLRLDAAHFSRYFTIKRS